MVMTVNEVAELIEKDYEQSKDTIKNSSYDEKNGEFLCDSSRIVFNYDMIIEKIYMGKDRPQSPDAIYIDNKINFIEFKNAAIKNSEKKLQICLKAVEGIYNFEKHIIKETNCNISDISRYIIVYSEKKNEYKDESAQKKNDIKRHISNKAKKKIIKFNLQRIEGTYYSEVFTLTENEFKKEFLKEIS